MVENVEGIQSIARIWKKESCMTKLCLLPLTCLSFSAVAFGQETVFQWSALDNKKTCYLQVKCQTKQKTLSDDQKEPVQSEEIETCWFRLDSLGKSEGKYLLKL